MKKFKIQEIEFWENHYLNQLEFMFKKNAYYNQKIIIPLNDVNKKLNILYLHLLKNFGTSELEFSDKYPLFETSNAFLHIDFLSDNSKLSKKFYLDYCEYKGKLYLKFMLLLYLKRQNHKNLFIDSIYLYSIPNNILKEHYKLGKKQLTIINFNSLVRNYSRRNTLFLFLSGKKERRKILYNYNNNSN